MYIARHLEEVVREANEAFPVIMVTGPRQVGKTTMLEHLAKPDRTVVSLDSPIARDMAKTDPELFLQRFQPPVLIDEFQYAKELLPYIKMYVDRHKNAGDFWLTGSQMFHMMNNVSESLAGRVAVIPMQGLSGSEIAGQGAAVFTGAPDALADALKTRAPMDLMAVYRRIFKGSMPLNYSKKPNREIFYRSYLDTYVQRDIRDLKQVGDESAFLRFMTACAARTGQQVTYTELARDAGVSPPTAKQWLSVLVASGIVTLLEPYFNNALKRIVKSPKMYFMDTGFCCYLTRWDSAETLEASMMSGAIFETYVVSEIVKTYYNAGKRPPLYYYRDTDQQEIDLILAAGDTLCPFEVKKTAAPDKRAVQRFGLLEKTGRKIGAGGIICMTDSVYPLGKDSNCIPVWLI